MPVTHSKSSSSMKREQMQKTILNAYNFMKKAEGERATPKKITEHHVPYQLQG
jgi:hypothetical protein